MTGYKYSTPTLMDDDPDGTMQQGGGIGGAP
jgi:hypothetical protein